MNNMFLPLGIMAVALAGVSPVFASGEAETVTELTTGDKDALRALVLRSMSEEYGKPALFTFDYPPEPK